MMASIIIPENSLNGTTEYYDEYGNRLPLLATQEVKLHISHLIVLTIVNY